MHIFKIDNSKYSLNFGNGSTQKLAKLPKDFLGKPAQSLHADEFTNSIKKIQENAIGLPKINWIKQGEEFHLILRRITDFFKQHAFGWDKLNIFARTLDPDCDGPRETTIIVGHANTILDKETRVFDDVDYFKNFKFEPGAEPDYNDIRYKEYKDNKFYYSISEEVMSYIHPYTIRKWRNVVSGYQKSVEDKAKEAIKTAIYDGAIDVILQYEKAKPENSPNERLLSLIEKIQDEKGLPAEEFNIKDSSQLLELVKRIAEEGSDTRNFLTKYLDENNRDAYKELFILPSKELTNAINKRLEKEKDEKQNNIENWRIFLDTFRENHPKTQSGSFFDYIRFYQWDAKNIKDYIEIENIFKNLCIYKDYSSKWSYLKELATKNSMSEDELRWSEIFDQFQASHRKRDYVLKNLVEQYQDSLKPKVVEETESKLIEQKPEKSKNKTKKTVSKKTQETNTKTKNNVVENKITKKTTKKKTNENTSNNISK